MPNLPLVKIEYLLGILLRDSPNAEGRWFREKAGSPCARFFCAGTFYHKGQRKGQIFTLINGSCLWRSDVCQPFARMDLVERYLIATAAPMQSTGAADDVPRAQKSCHVVGLILS